MAVTIPALADDVGVVESRVRRALASRRRDYDPDPLDEAVVAYSARSCPPGWVVPLPSGSRHVRRVLVVPE